MGEKRKVELDLKPLRKAKKLSQQQVADILGISRQQYVGIENNQTESVNKGHLETLCELFDCEVAELFGAVPQTMDISSQVSEAIALAESALGTVRSSLGM